MGGAAAGREGTGLTIGCGGETTGEEEAEEGKRRRRG